MRNTRTLTVWLCFALAVCLSLPVKIKGEAPAAGEDLKNLAQELTEQLHAGDLDATVQRLDPSIADQLPREAMETVNAQVSMLAGDFERVTGVVRNDTPQGIIVDVYAQHTGRPVQLRFVFNEKALITGLWIQPVTPEAVAALFPEADQGNGESPSGQEFPVTVGEYDLPGVITVPEGDLLPIAVVLVAGSGPNDRDGTVGRAGNKPLRDLAWGLAEKGITTLRYDKRSMVRPDTLGEKPTIEAEVLDDVTTAIALISQHEKTRGYSLFVLGHSLGGMLAPAILKQNPALSGAVILAGTPRTLWDVIYDQNAAMIPALDQYSQQEKDALLSEIAGMRDLANAVTQDGDGQLFNLPFRYIASLNNLHLADLARETTKPLLILQGEKDAQVSAETDYPAWQTLLKGHGNAEFKLYEGLNHLFMESATGTLADYDQPGHVAQEAVKDVAAWLTAQMQ